MINDNANTHACCCPITAQHIHKSLKVSTKRAGEIDETNYDKDIYATHISSYISIQDIRMLIFNNSTLIADIEQSISSNIVIAY